MSESATTYTTAAQIRHSIRPWTDLLYPITLPNSFPETSHRLQRNLYTFRGNYAIISLLILSLSLVFHPISIIVFFLIFSAWIFLYFFRDEPQLIVFGHTVGDRLLFLFLTVVTVAALFLTNNVWRNVLVSAATAAAVVCLHAALMNPPDNDYPGNDMDSPYGALLSVVDE